MRRMTVIESPEHRMGGEIYYREDKYAHDPELHRAFKDGEECGYEKAMQEMRGGYNERRMYDDRGRVLYRGDERGWDDDDMYNERRRRSRTTGRWL